jgi:hypothetical protein
VIRSELRVPGFRGILWEAAAAPGRVSQDASAVVERGGILRVGVIDGRTPSSDAPRVLGCDLGVHAAQIVRHALHGDGTLDNAFELANDFLHAAQDAARSAYAEATCIAVDIDAGGATVLQAGDCDAWVLEADGWRRLFPEGAMTGEAAELDRRWYAESANLDLASLLREERAREYVNDESAWRTAALGRFSRAKLDRAAVAEWHAFALATDGARLTAGRLGDLDAWLGGLRDWERAATTEDGVYPWKPHDDITVLRIERVA